MYNINNKMVKEKTEEKKVEKNSSKNKGIPCWSCGHISCKRTKQCKNCTADTLF